MSALPDNSGWRPADVSSLLSRKDTRGVLISASRDPDAKATFIATSKNATLSRSYGSRLAVKIPMTRMAGVAVEREGRMLVALRRMRLESLGDTIPRYVQSRQVEGRPVLVSTALPGTPMSVAYHQWLHTARPRAVQRDFALAGDWLARFQAASAAGTGPVTWAADIADQLRGRWDGHPGLANALVRVEDAHRRLAEHQTVSCAVHGDFWFGNLLVTDGRITGVIDWESAEPEGSPLRDLARFALSYSLYLDRHTSPGSRVVGHPGLRRTGFGAGIGYALVGPGWMPRLVRSFLADGLVRLGIPADRWYDVALTGLGEVAASANDPDFGAGHLELLGRLPAHPRRHQG